MAGDVSEYAVRFEVSMPIENVIEYLENNGYAPRDTATWTSGARVVTVSRRGRLSTDCILTPDSVPMWRGDEHLMHDIEMARRSLLRALGEATEEVAPEQTWPDRTPMPPATYLALFGDVGDNLRDVMMNDARDRAVQAAIDAIVSARGDVLHTSIAEGVEFVIRGDASPSEFPAFIGPADRRRTVVVFCNGVPFGRAMWEGSHTIQGSALGIETPRFRRPPQRGVALEA